MILTARSNELCGAMPVRRYRGTISSDEYDSMKSTLEVLSDNELIEQIKESREDYKSGRFKKLRELMNE